ncbi:MAG: methyl-accepting chemotaxis protein [Candidatus Sulfopaludibacter sp.]|nr:methyl-accepting chemotaxis protein [Candidatus Sulfopaludibacter sp.]
MRVIDEIAFPTTIVALNAAVESARGGDAVDRLDLLVG